jgi:hypothetical protein
MLLENRSEPALLPVPPLNNSPNRSPRTDHRGGLHLGGQGDSSDIFASPFPFAHRPLTYPHPHSSLGTLDQG